MGKRILISCLAAAGVAVLVLLLLDVPIAGLFGGSDRADATSVSAPDAASADDEAQARHPVLESRPGAVEGGPARPAPRTSSAPAEATADAGAGLVGRVVTADGRPLAGVRVFAADADGVTVEGITDAEGRFHLALAAGRYDLVFRGGRDGSLLMRSFVVDGRVRTDLSFALGGAAEVRVELMRDGNGVQGTDVKVRLRFDGVLETIAEGKTDGSGRFLADSVPSGPYTVEVAATESVVLARSLDVSGDVTVPFVLPHAVRISGVVTDAETRAPVAASLDASFQAKDGSLIHVTGASAGDGRYDIEVLAAQPTAFLVLAPEYAPFPQQGPERQAVLSAVSVLRAEKNAVLDVGLKRGSVTRGVITYQGTKETVPNLALRFRPNGGLFPGRTTTTRADGSYTILGAGPGSWDALIETPGWYVVTRANVRVPNVPGEIPFDMEVLSAGLVSGTVVLADGHGAAGARAWLVGGGGAIRNARRAGRDLETFTSADGTFSIGDVPPNVNFRVRAALGEAEATPSAVYNLAQAAPPPVRLVLQATGRIRGQVTDVATRLPIGSARVQADPAGEPAGRTGRGFQTDAEGRFEVSGLIPGSWRLTPKRSDYLPAEPQAVELPLATLEAEAHLTLDPGLSIAGGVVDASGNAIAGAQVRLNGTEDGADPNRPVQVRRNAATDPNGAWHWQGLRPGSYTLTARASGFLTATLNRLRGGEDRLRVVLERVPPPPGD